MIEELIQGGSYQQALSLLTDMNDEKTRYLRLACLIGLGEYQTAKAEGFPDRHRHTRPRGRPREAQGARSLEPAVPGNRRSR